MRHHHQRADRLRLGLRHLQAQQATEAVANHHHRPQVLVMQVASSCPRIAGRNSAGRGSAASAPASPAAAPDDTAQLSGPGRSRARPRRCCSGRGSSAAGDLCRPPSTCTLPAAGRCGVRRAGTEHGHRHADHRQPGQGLIAYQSARKIFIICSFVGWVLPGWNSVAPTTAPGLRFRAAADRRGERSQATTVPPVRIDNIHLDGAIY